MNRLKEKYHAYITHERADVYHRKAYHGYPLAYLKLGAVGRRNPAALFVDLCLLFCK